MPDMPELPYVQCRDSRRDLPLGLINSEFAKMNAGLVHCAFLVYVARLSFDRIGFFGVEFGEKTTRTGGGNRRNLLEPPKVRMKLPIRHSWSSKITCANRDKSFFIRETESRKEFRSGAKRYIFSKVMVFDCFFW
jgi:hypothetical protein